MFVSKDQVSSVFHPKNILYKQAPELPKQYTLDGTTNTVKTTDSQADLTVKAPFKKTIQYIFNGNKSEDHMRSCNLHGIDHIELTNAYLRYIGEGSGIPDNTNIYLRIDGLSNQNDFISLFPETLNRDGLHGYITVVSAQQLMEPVHLRSFQHSEGVLKSLQVTAFGVISGAVQQLDVHGFVTLTFHLSIPK